MLVVIMLQVHIVRLTRIQMEHHVLTVVHRIVLIIFVFAINFVKITVNLAAIMLINLSVDKLSIIILKVLWIQLHVNVLVLFMQQVVNAKLNYVIKQISNTTVI